ncbi:MAG: tetratricopeptide repeat protein [Chitinophagaceae bacterium]
MKHTILLMSIGLLLSMGLRAQKTEDGKKFLYSNRLVSAKATLEKTVANEPKNTEAIYWLGQTYLMMDNIAGARNLYQKAALEFSSQPIIQVGLGHIDLLEGRNTEARALFEDAIAKSMSRKKENPVILNAIGRANADGATTVGDPAYGVEKLLRSIELDPGHPEPYIDLGINYLKMGGDRGGDAYKAFNNALEIDPNYAAAKYRLGKIFLSQNNIDKFIGYFTGALQSDSTYAPAYLELYNYYALRDVNKARGYLEKYMTNSDKDCNVDFFYGDYLFRSGKYQESLDKAQAMQNGLCKDYPRLKVLLAYNYDRLGDSNRAKENIQAYISKSPADKITREDYLFAATVLGNITGGEDSAISYLKTALARDTARATRFVYMDTIAGLYKKMEQWDKRVEWLQRSFEANPNPSNFDIYNLGDAALLAQNYGLADSMFNKYKAQYPEQIYGYLGLAKSAIARDKDTTAGTAVAAVQDYTNYLEKTDTAKYKSRIFQNYAYLVYVHANVFKDFPAALHDLEGLLAVDPENNYAKQTSEQIKKIIASQGGKGAAGKQDNAGEKKSTTKPAGKKSATKVAGKKGATKASGKKSTT